MKHENFIRFEAHEVRQMIADYLLKNEHSGSYNELLLADQVDTVKLEGEELVVSIDQSIIRRKQ